MSSVTALIGVFLFIVLILTGFYMKVLWERYKWYRFSYTMAVIAGDGFVKCVNVMYWAYRRKFITWEQMKSVLMNMKDMPAEEREVYQERILEEIEDMLFSFYVACMTGLSEERLLLERRLMHDLIVAVSEGKIVLYFLSTQFCCIRNT